MPLFCVATPIGNLGDLTFRALEVLKNADIILAEDTRKTGFLLEHYGVSQKVMYVMTDHTSSEEIAKYAELIKEKNVCLVSDAGTPMIADPGYKLIAKAHEIGAKVSPIPGCSSVIAALSICGLEVHNFGFFGFYDRKKLRATLGFEAALCFFVPARDLPETLAEIKEHLGERKVAVLRELTKLYEDIKSAEISSMMEYYANEERCRGEAVLIISPREIKGEEPDLSIMLEGILRKFPHISELRTKDAAEVLAFYEREALSAFSKKEIYNALEKMRSNNKKL